MPVERAGLSAVDIPDLSELHTPLRSGRIRNRVDDHIPSNSGEDEASAAVKPTLVHSERPREATSIIVSEPEKKRSTAHAAYPSLTAAPREHLIPYSVRLPLSQIEALDKLCRARNIDKSNLVRDFIAVGLKSLDEELAALK